MAFTSTGAQVSDILKIYYEGPIRDLLNSRKILMRYAMRRKRDYHGKQVYVPVHIGRNSGVAVGSSEGGNFPVPGNQQYKHAEYVVRQIYGSFEISGLGKATTKDNIGAFAQGLQTEMDGIATDVQVNVNRMMCGDGSGTLTQANDTATTASITVQSTKYLRAGMGVQIFSTAGTDKTSGGVTVNSVDSSTTATLSTTTSARTATDMVVMTGSRTAGSFGSHFEPWGLHALINNVNPASQSPANGLTDTVGNLTRASATYWQGNIVGNSGTNRPLTLDLMQQAWDVADIEGGDDEDGVDGRANNKIPLGLILTNHACKRRYAGLLVADKRYPAGGEIILDGGYNALDFNGCPLVADKDLAKPMTPQTLNSLFFLNLKTLELFMLENFGFVDDSGQVLLQKVGAAGASGVYADALQGYYRSYFEFGVVEPNANAWLQDIDENP